VYVYTILDAARDERIYPTLLEANREYCCLYRGDMAQELAEVAPYLVTLEPQAPFTTWLISHGWGDSWGIFLESSAPLEVLRRHFRRFLMVYDEQGKPLYFRYYDPRVLRVYLPTCTATELDTVFGPVRRYYVEGEDDQTLLEYAYTGAHLTQRRVHVSDADRAFG
jgi:hypothetical protein